MPQLNNWMVHCQTYPLWVNKMIRTSHWFCKQIRQKKSTLVLESLGFYLFQSPSSISLPSLQVGLNTEPMGEGNTSAQLLEDPGKEPEFASGDMKSPCVLRLFRNLKLKSLSFHLLGRGFMFSASAEPLPQMHSFMRLARWSAIAAWIGLLFCIQDN